MEKVKIIIVEDNSVVAEDLSQILTGYGYQVVAVVDNGYDALEKIKLFDPDMALLDIHLKGDITGIEVAQVINEKHVFPFIFLSAYSDEVTFGSAKLTRPHAYIVKPFNEKELKLAIELALFSYSKADQETELPSTDQGYFLRDSIFVKEGTRFIKVPLTEILYLEATGSYSKLFSIDREFTISCNLNKLSSKIAEHSFIRIHRSYVVNLNHIKGINGESIEIGKVNLPISFTYRKLLMERLRLI
ncbi:MAG TPA: response regulator [Cyclobacteriaceae bacterium]